MGSSSSHHPQKHAHQVGACRSGTGAQRQKKRSKFFFLLFWLPPSVWFTPADHFFQYTMASFIKSLAVSMNAAGLAPRATTLFNQAKAIGFFRWGRRAKLVAGACIAISLRESSRPDSIQDISVLLKCSPSLLSRTFVSVTSTLQITTLSVDPTVYLTTLQSYLASTAQGGAEHQVEIGLPAALVKSLQGLSLHAVNHTATSLCLTLARTGRIDKLSGGLCRSEDFAAVKRRMASFMAAGFLSVCKPKAKAAP